MKNQFVAINGKLQSITKKEAKEIIIDLGGNFQANINSKTTIVVNGKDPIKKKKQIVKVLIKKGQDKVYQFKNRNSSNGMGYIILRKEKTLEDLDTLINAEMEKKSRELQENNERLESLKQEVRSKEEELAKIDAIALSK